MTPAQRRTVDEVRYLLWWHNGAVGRAHAAMTLGIGVKAMEDYLRDAGRQDVLDRLMAAEPPSGSGMGWKCGAPGCGSCRPRGSHQRKAGAAA